jgi:predicted ABC-type ATPase
VESISLFEFNMERNSKIIVIAGPNGAGKSTIAENLLSKKFGLIHFVNADMIARGLSAFASEKLAVEAGRIMLRRLNKLAEKRANFAFETTLSSRAYAGWIDNLKKNGYEFHLFFLWLPSPELAIERVAGRVAMGGHNIPEEVIRRRYYKGVQNFFELYQKRADTWTVYVYSFTPPLLVAEGIREIRIVQYTINLGGRSLVRVRNEFRNCKSTKSIYWQRC